MNTMQRLHAVPESVVTQHREFYREVADALKAAKKRPLVENEVGVLEGILADLEAGQTSPSG